MKLRFEKYEGLGNDFLVVDDPGAREVLTSAAAVRLCDRHRGVGGDGVLLTGLAGGRPFLRVLNADGSVPEMCGNGVRCVALHLFANGVVGLEPFDLDTDAGPHRVKVHDPSSVEVWMRPASLRPEDLPLVSDHPWIDEPVEVAGVALRLTAVSMGNPHVVAFDAPTAALERLGPALEVDPRFPERVNVGFARVHDGVVTLRVWERGVGWTQACGTGACAAAVAAVETGRATRNRELDVRLPGGALTIEVGSVGEPVRMTGPARHVFSGVVTL